MLIPFSTTISTWSGVPPSTSARPAAPSSRPSRLALAAHLRTRDRGVLLEQDADRRCGEQEPHDAIIGEGPRRSRGSSAGPPGRCPGAVGGRGDHATARRVLLVDRERVELGPLHGPEGVGAVVGGLEGLEEAGRPAAHFRPPGRVPLARTPRSNTPASPSRCAAARRGPLLGAPGQLVGQHQLADAEPRLTVAVQQLVAGAER